MILEELSKLQILKRYGPIAVKIMKSVIQKKFLLSNVYNL